MAGIISCLVMSLPISCLEPSQIIMRGLSPHLHYLPIRVSSFLMTVCGRKNVNEITISSFICLSSLYGDELLPSCLIPAFSINHLTWRVNHLIKHTPSAVHGVIPQRWYGCLYESGTHLFVLRVDEPRPLERIVFQKKQRTHPGFTR